MNGRSYLACDPVLCIDHHLVVAGCNPLLSPHSMLYDNDISSIAVLASFVCYVFSDRVIVNGGLRNRKSVFSELIVDIVPTCFGRTLISSGMVDVAVCSLIFILEQVWIFWWSVDLT